jgi:ferredoxin
MSDESPTDTFAVLDRFGFERPPVGVKFLYHLDGGSMAVSIMTNECNGCGRCVDVCAFSAFEVRDGVTVVDSDACAKCSRCLEECKLLSMS